MDSSIQFNLKLVYEYKGTIYSSYFEKWTSGGTAYGNKTRPQPAGTFSATDTLTHYNELKAHYDPLEADGTISDLKITILESGTTNEASVDFVKENIVTDIKNLNGLADFEPAKLNEHELLASNYWGMYVHFQEMLGGTMYTMPFRQYLETNMPDQYRSDVDAIIAAVQTLKAKIFNKGEPHIAEDAPEKDRENFISMPV